MRIFDYKKLEKISWDNEVLAYIAEIREYKGKQALYENQKPQILSRLVDVAMIQSTEASNSIEGIMTTVPRLRSLAKQKTTPKNRDEEEILGYRNVLSTIHESYDFISLNSNHILQLHRDLFSYTPLSYGGKFKTTPNEIDMVYKSGKREVVFKPLEPYETPDAISKLCKEYSDAIERGKIEPLILISYFILDFLCIHPFNDGNGRMSRLLTLLLTYQNGYTVGKYISIEQIIADTKKEYYKALSLSNENWHESKNDILPFLKYMLGVILKAYRKFEERIEIIDDGTGKKSSYDTVSDYSEHKLGTFTKADLLEDCPTLGHSSAEASLKRLVEEGLLIREGQGKNTKYYHK